MLNDRLSNGRPADTVYHAVLPDTARGLDPDSYLGESPYWQDKTVCGRKSPNASALVWNGNPRNEEVIGCKTCNAKLEGIIAAKDSAYYYQPATKES